MRVRRRGRLRAQLFHRDHRAVFVSRLLRTDGSSRYTAARGRTLNLGYTVPY